jgi:hypothetical protein
MTASTTPFEKPVSRNVPVACISQFLLFGFGLAGRDPNARFWQAASKAQNYANLR